jgi:general secretion pathway protein G
MKNRTGFTLVELVVVILILGILAGVAAPRMFDTAAKATDNGLQQTLSVVRDAIELYMVENGGAPPAFASSDAFQGLLTPYVRGDFPNCPVGARAGANTVIALAEAAGSTNATGAWRYDAVTGAFAVNYAAVTVNTDDDPALTYDAL